MTKIKDSFAIHFNFIIFTSGESHHHTQLQSELNATASFLFPHIICVIIFTHGYKDAQNYHIFNV